MESKCSRISTGLLSAFLNSMLHVVIVASRSFTVLFGKAETACVFMMRGSADAAADNSRRYRSCISEKAGSALFSALSKHVVAQVHNNPSVSRMGRPIWYCRLVFTVLIILVGIILVGKIYTSNWDSFDQDACPFRSTESHLNLLVWPRVQELGREKIPAVSTN